MSRKLKTALALVGLSVVVIVAADLLGRVASAVDDRYFGPPADHLLADDDLRASLPAYDGVDTTPARCSKRSERATARCTSRTPSGSAERIVGSTRPLT